MVSPFLLRPRPRRVLRIAVALAVVASAPLLSAVAQTVRGTVTGGNPPAVVPGVIVMLLDSAGSIVDRSLSSPSGQYRLRGSSQGTYRLRALRIGFRPTETPPFGMLEGQTVERALPLNGLAVSLERVQVTAGQRCATQRAPGSAAFDLWDEARKALEAALLTEAQPHTMEMVRYERRLSANGASIVRETQTEVRGPAVRPFVSVRAEDLDSLGYVVADGDGFTYRAPDERVLLSEQFAASHCFAVGEPRAPDEVALRFEPVRGRALPEISGTLTLARATGELRRLEIRYVNVPDDVRRAEAAGEVFFRRLPSGGWIVERWMLRLPLFAQVTQQRVGQLSDLARGGLTRVSSVVLANLQESGGEVYEVASGDSVIWSRPRPTLAGRVRDDGGRPLAHATIGLPTLARATTSDGAGRFSFRSVRPGRRQITVAWPLTDSLGLAPFVREVNANGSDTVEVVVPSREAALAEACNAPSPGALAAIGFVRGVTRDSSGRRVGGVQVVASWFEAPSTRLETARDLVQRTLRTGSSATGDFAICGIPAGSVFVLQGFSKATGGARVSARMPREERVVLMDVPVTEGPLD